MNDVIAFASRCLLLVVMLLSGCASVTGIQTHHEQFNELSRASPDWDHQRRAQFEARYREWFSPVFSHSSLRLRRTFEVELLYSAGHLVSFYATDAHVEDMRRAFDELVMRGKASATTYQDMYETYVLARQFDQARQFASLHTTVEFEAIPDVLDPIGDHDLGPTELALDVEGVALERRAVHLEHGVLAVFHPNCHFSQNAVAAIEADPALTRLFREQAHWLQPPDGRIEFDSFRAWISEHSPERVGIAWSTSEWRSFDLTSTPTFYFVRQGKVVATVSGWPKEGRRDELLAAARRAGLLP